jgi:hypothetical protein
MDFNEFDSRSLAEDGAAMDIMHPVTGEPMMDDGHPCRVFVRGAESRKVQAALSSANKARTNQPTNQTMGDIHLDLVKNAKRLITGFENVDRGDKPATADDAEWFLDLNMINGQEGEKSFAEQVLAFATKRANYLGNASKP